MTSYSPSQAERCKIRTDLHRTLLCPRFRPDSITDTERLLQAVLLVLAGDVGLKCGGRVWHRFRETVCKVTRLRWAGHVVRTDDNEVPKKI